MTSHSVASAIKQPFFLQTINFTSIALFALWALSPLVSQAMQRMTWIAPGASIGTLPIGYVSTDVNSSTFLSPTSVTPGQATGWTSYTAEITALYSACLMAPASINASTMDTWGNVKIPLIENLGGTAVNGWFNVSNATTSGYSSMLGIPFVNLPGNGTSDLTMQSSYLAFNCTTGSGDIGTAQAWNNTAKNVRLSPSGALIMDSDDETQMIWIASLSLGGNGNPGGLYNTATCHFTWSHVDSHVACEADQCAVTAMRYTPNPRTNPFVTEDLTDTFVNATGESGQSGLPSLTERYISDPGSTNKGEEEYFDFSEGISTALFTQRLALLINTFWQAGFAPTVQTGGASWCGGDTQCNYPSTITNTTNTWTDTSPVYVTSWGWLAALFLLIFGAASIVWDLQTIGPDIFGFASSIVRKNKYMRIPDLPSNVRGLERAKALAKVKVMLQDGKADSEVGKIVLGTVSEDAQRLRPGRLYK